MQWKKTPHCNFQIVFQTKCNLMSFFTFIDKVPVFLPSGIVYKFKCGSCNATSYRKTKHHFKVRMCEHLGVSVFIGKWVKGNNDSAITKYHFFAINHLALMIVFIPASNRNDFKTTLMESFLINRDHPPLNKNRHSLPLKLFDDWAT